MNIAIQQLFETIGRLHTQVEGLQAEIAKRDAIITAAKKTAAPAPQPAAN